MRTGGGERDFLWAGGAGDLSLWLPGLPTLSRSRGTEIERMFLLRAGASSAGSEVMFSNIAIVFAMEPRTLGLRRVSVILMTLRSVGSGE